MITTKKLKKNDQIFALEKQKVKSITEKVGLVKYLFDQNSKLNNETIETQIENLETQKDLQENKKQMQIKLKSRLRRYT